MRELFREYGLFIAAIVGAAIIVGTFFKLFWGNDSVLAPVILEMLNGWIG